MKARKYIQYALTLMASFMLASALYLLLYNYDNKYTEPAPVLDDGVVHLENVPLSNKPVHLVEGWVFFPDSLLTPQDFSTGEPYAYKTIYIGQYPGFEAGDKSRPPHGSATYRLNILLPPEVKNYTLELPEIYSAYKLYINGELMAGMGNTEPENYEPRTGNTAVSFRAKDSVEIILAVTDYSGFYSGLTYPPAFGEAGVVSHLLSLRFFIRLLACCAALLIGLFYLVTGAMSKRGRLSVLYGAMCLLFVGSICYPVIKTLWASGPIWYQFEDFCYNAMLLCVILIGGKLTGLPNRVINTAAVIGSLFSVAALASPLFINQGLGGMYAFSSLMNIYSWSSAAYLTAAVAFSVYKNGLYAKLILGGVAFFDCALILDRLLPKFEPIYFGWFTEVAGAALVCCFGIAMTGETIRQAKERLVMEGRIDSMSQLVDMQRRYYPVVMESIKEAQAARHDLRHHMRLIRELAGENNNARLMAYLQEYHADAQPDGTVTYSENYVADTLVRHFASLAAGGKVRFDASVDMPEHVGIPDADLAIVMGNLLENALEACAGVLEQEAYIKTSVRFWNNQLIIVVRNSFDGELKQKNGQLFSRKREDMAGVGLESVRVAAHRQGGSAEFSAEGKEFEASVVLMAAAQDKRQEEAPV